MKGAKGAGGGVSERRGDPGAEFYMVAALADVEDIRVGGG